MMTYSNEDGKPILMRVVSTPMQFEPPRENKLQSPSHVLSEETVGLPQLPDLCAIDMTSFNRIQARETERQIFSEKALLDNFERLSMDKSSMSKESTGLCFSCEISRTASNSTAGTLQETARDLLLFVGDGDGDTPLHLCIMQGDEARSSYIINRAPDFTYLSIQNNFLQTPAHLASLTNASKIIRKLICAGADIHYQDKDGNTPLHLACKHGHLEIVKQLLRPVSYEETLGNKYPLPFLAIPQNMDVKNYEGQTCLHLAVLHQNVDIMRLLMEAGADPNIGDSKSGRTPLHFAAEQGMLDCVILLTHYRATEIDAMSYAKHKPALLAFSRGHVKVVELLAHYGASYGFYYQNEQNECDGSSSEMDSDMDDYLRLNWEY